MNYRRQLLANFSIMASQLFTVIVKFSLPDLDAETEYRTVRCIVTCGASNKTASDGHDVCPDPNFFDLQTELENLTEHR